MLFSSVISFSRPDFAIKVVIGRWVRMQMQLFIKLTATSDDAQNNIFVLNQCARPSGLPLHLTYLDDQIKDISMDRKWERNGHKVLAGKREGRGTGESSLI
jgi:hypothetical protein